MITELIEQWKKKGVDAALAFFDQEKKNPKTKYEVDAEQLYDLTNVLLNRQHPEESLIVARKNCTYFPDSDLSYEALGKSLFWNGHMDECKQAYEKARDLNSENRWANLVLSQLDKKSSTNVSGTQLTLRGFGNAKAVAVAGIFNEWQSLQNICLKNNEGLWECSLSLLPGTYPYRFIVDGKWVDDPSNAPTREFEKGFFVSELQVK